MTTTNQKQSKRQPRRQLIVDRSMQLRVAATCASIAGIAGMLCVAAIFLIPSATAFERMNAVEARMVLIWSVGGFFIASIGVVTMLAVILTHRLAGPSRVIVSAIQKMGDGDFTGRLRLRPHDYLKPVADAAKELQTDLNKQAEERARREDLLRELVAAEDLDGLRELLDQPAQEPAPETVSD